MANEKMQHKKDLKKQNKLKVIILAGGFASRLGEIAKNCPKPLLKVGNKPNLDYLMEKIENIKNKVSDVVVVGNSKFEDNFRQWLDGKQFGVKVAIVNDNGKDEKTKPGALGGLKYALDALQYDGDIMLLAGDNYADFEIGGLVDLFWQKNRAPILMGKRFKENQLEYLGKNLGVVEIDKNNKIVEIEEKPGVPKSDIGSCGFYVLPNARGSLEKYFNAGFSHDNLGNYVKWLRGNEPVYCCVTDGVWIDFGTPDSYKEVNDYIAKKYNNIAMEK